MFDTVTVPPVDRSRGRLTSVTRGHKSTVTAIEAVSTLENSASSYKDVRRAQYIGFAQHNILDCKQKINMR